MSIPAVPPASTVAPAPTEVGEHKPFDPAEHLSLYKFKVITEIKDEILAWAQVRLALLTSVLSIIILTGSIVGIRLMVEGHIERIARAPVEQRINVLNEAGQQAKERVEALKFQSEHVVAQSIQSQHELTKLKAEAENIQRIVKQTEPSVQKALETLTQLKEGANLSTQFAHEQALRTKADMLQMRNNVELLQSGFEIIEKLAGEIRQKDPKSELARQFAGFSAQWREARAAYERRSAVIKSRRDIKVIHYLREDASPERQQQSQRFVDALLAHGYTAEGWVTRPGASEVEAAVQVAREFGVDAKGLFQPALILSPSSALNTDDLAEIAMTLGITLPAIRRAELAPTMKEILAGGETGAFKPASIVLFAELSGGK